MKIKLQTNLRLVFLFETEENGNGIGEFSECTVSSQWKGEMVSSIQHPAYPTIIKYNFVGKILLHDFEVYT